MYFSKYHSGLCFIDRGMGNLEISGKGSISASDTETWNQDESWKEQCTVLTVYDGITAICVGVLEQFPNMVKLRLPKSVTRIRRAEYASSHKRCTCSCSLWLIRRYRRTE